MNIKAFGFVFLFTVAQASSAPLRIAVEGAYPPFNQVNLEGKLEGYDVDVALAICAELKRSCDLQMVPWDGMIPGLLAKKFDVIVSSMSISPERAKQVLFTQNYYRLGAVLVSNKSKNLDVKSAGLVVGVQRGATYESFAKKLNATWKLKIYDKAKDHNQDLKLGRLDAVLGQQVIMADFIKENSKFKIQQGPFYDDETLGVGAGIAFRKDDKRLAGEFDQVITKFKQSGKLKELAKKYFNIDISGDAKN